MDGTPLVTGDPAQAMAINSKIGIVTGLTLDPIKKVHEFDLIAKKCPKFYHTDLLSDSHLLSWCSGLTKRARYCGTAPTPPMTVESLPLPSSNGLQVNQFHFSILDSARFIVVTYFNF